MSALAERPATLLEAETASAASIRPWRSIAIVSDLAALADAWRALESHAILTPYQAYGWVTPFAETVGAAKGLDLRIAVLRDQRDVVQAILPLTITRRFGVRFAEFTGGKHANYHMGLYAPDFAAALDADATCAMLREIGRQISGLDAFVFVNQPVSWQGVTNPTAQLSPTQSPSAAYKLALMPGDCEGTLRRAISSHAHKKLKNKRNRFATFGPSRVVKAESEAEVAAVLDAFLSQKAARFHAMGISDPFAEPSVRAFLQQGALPAGGQPPVLELYGLELNGACVATYIGAVMGTRFSGMATSFDMDSEAARSSPGEILLIELIKRKCHAGVTTFDLGIGEARYKTTICDGRDHLVDSYLSLTLKGRVFALLSRAQRIAKRRVKASPRALKLMQRASGLLRRRSAVSAED